jgi:prevent-host-death family protein
METITVRELRNHGGRVLERVARGECLTVTLDGRPVAELRPLPGRSVSAAILLSRWRSLPHMDVDAFRRDVDEAVDASL